MASDEKRYEVAEELRRQAAYSSGSLGEWWQRLQETVTGEVDFANPQVTYRAIADLIEPKPVTGATSDGFHTFDELYRHRAVLFSFIVTCFPGASWKSRRHHDGTMYDGMFIVGIETPWGQATYHYDVDKCWDMFPCWELDSAPEWDGHTPDQAIERIERLARRLTDARDGERAEIRSCWNVYDKGAHGDVKNGFKCSACGETSENGDRYRVGGAWKYCPGCGGRVLRLR